MAMDNLAAQTSLGISGPLGCTENIDVRFGETGLDVDGRWECDLEDIYAWEVICRSATVRINVNNMDPGEDWKQTACHEVGHSVGLRHGGTTDCMAEGSNGTPAGHLQYNGHHITHINNQA